MGWDFYAKSKPELVADLTKDWAETTGTKHTCLAHCVRGNTLWTIWEVSDKRFIGCDLLARQVFDGKHLWGNKGMTEGMGPDVSNCPIDFLDMVPAANNAWRVRVLMDAVSHPKARVNMVFHENELAAQRSMF